MNKIFSAASMFLSLTAGVCFAEGFPQVTALKPMPPAYLNTGPTIEASNMPEGMTQGGLPICYAITAWHLYQQHVCRESNQDCKRIDPRQSPSPLAIAAIGISRTFTEKYPGTQAIPFNTGGRLSASLRALDGMEDIYADACYPWAKFAEKYHDDDRAMWQAFDKLRSNFYDKYRAEGQACIPCLQEALKRDFDLAASPEKLEAALKEIVFERFLYAIFLKGCQDKAKIGEFYEGGWPGGSEPTYAGFINTLKRVLGANTPASVGFCADVKVANLPKGQDCNHAHIVTVSGYRQVCTQGNCTDYLRVLNSWGQGWQATNSDGWIDARNFYDYVDSGSGAMEWISKKASGEPK